MDRRCRVDIQNSRIPERIRNPMRNSKILNQPSSEVNCEEHYCGYEEAISKYAQTPTNHDRSCILNVDFCTSCELLLIFLSVSLFLVPPGTFTEEVGTNFRGSNRTHGPLSFFSSWAMDLSRCSWRRLSVRSPRVRSIMLRAISVWRRIPPVIAFG